MTKRCVRCGCEPGAWTTSMFNSDDICLDCKEDERHAPGYKLAREAEAAAVARGDFNFPGVGMTRQDRVAMKERREERALR